MEKMLPNLPEFKVNAAKNGYEIRSDILAMAKDYVLTEYHAKMHGWEVTSHRTETGPVVNNVKMPDYPGLETILETAERLYSFVNKGTQSKKD